MNVIKKDGRIQEFDEKKINISLMSSTSSVNGGKLNESDISILVSDITRTINEIRKDGSSTSSYEVIGVVSSVLIRDGFKEILKSYLEY
ncbi:MAG: hypothetical protein E7214_04730 [Clostridium sp.]|nr:hypothetical protein [Clostridium sp.]